MAILTSIWYCKVTTQNNSIQKDTTAYEKNTIELPFWQAVLLCYDEIADEIFKLREQREKCTVDTAARDAQIARINELQDFIKQQPAHLEAFDEALVKRWL